MSCSGREGDPAEAVAVGAGSAVRTSGFFVGGGLPAKVRFEPSARMASRAKAFGPLAGSEQGRA